MASPAAFYNNECAVYFGYCTRGRGDSDKKLLYSTTNCCCAVCWARCAPLRKGSLGQVLKDKNLDRVCSRSSSLRGYIKCAHCRVLDTIALCPFNFLCEERAENIAALSVRWHAARRRKRFNVVRAVYTLHTHTHMGGNEDGGANLFIRLEWKIAALGTVCCNFANSKRVAFVLQSLLTAYGDNKLNFLTLCSGFRWGVCAVGGTHKDLSSVAKLSKHAKVCKISCRSK